MRDAPCGSATSAGSSEPVQSPGGPAPGLLLGCASPGSGLTVAPGAKTDFFLFISAPDVTIEGLVLDSAAAMHGPLRTEPLDPEPVASRLGMAGDQVTCGPSLCAFFVGAPDVVVTDNVIRGPWVRGINVAELRDSDIVGNVIEAWSRTEFAPA